jgi:hypothetical protein
METATETIDPITGESTAKTETASTVTAPVEGQAPQGEKESAGSPQGDAEDGKEEGTDTRKPFRSKNQTIYELRQRIREQEGSFSQKLDALEKRLEEMARVTNRGQDRKPSRTFFEAPEDTLKAIQSEQFKAFKEELLGELRQTEQERNQSSQWQQETSEAAKFITSQKGMTEDDIRDIEELVRSTPEMQAMTPMQRAKYAMYLWREERGITDKTVQKQRAATVVGSPGGPGPAELTEAEINKRLDEFPKDVSKWAPEDHKKWEVLEREILKSKGGQR